MIMIIIIITMLLCVEFEFLNFSSPLVFCLFLFFGVH